MGLQKPKGEVHSFNESLKRGKKGETQFVQLFGDLVEPLDGFIADGKIKASGATYEIKTDFYCPTKTANFAMEYISYGDQPGGPYQSLKKGIDYFIYFFPSCMQFHVWKTKALVRKLDKIKDTLQTVPIRNVSHTTWIYKVPRDLLSDIELNLEKVLKGKL